MAVRFVDLYRSMQEEYVRARYAGENRRSIEIAIANMDKYFSHVSKEEIERHIYDNPIFNEMMNSIKKGFKEWYDFECEEILLNHNFQKSLNSYVYNDTVNPVFIHIDQLLESIILCFMLSILKWGKNLQAGRHEDDFFTYILFVINELCILGELPSEEAKEQLMKKVEDDKQVHDVASDFHWAIMFFNAAHEIAHIYQMHADYEYWKKHPKEAEFNADEIAYDILLKTIICKEGEELIIPEYAYLSPIIYMDLFNLYYYTDFVLYDEKYYSETHPVPNERKERLFSIVERDIYQFDTEQGNAVYDCFLDVCDLYEEKLDKYHKDGRLEQIIKRELRLNRK